MNEQDFQLILRAKRQIKREATWRSFLLMGLALAAGLRLLNVELTLLYVLLFVLFLVSLVLTSDLLFNLGTVSKKDLLALIESELNKAPKALSDYAQSRDRD